MKVTKEQVDKAKANYDAICQAIINATYADEAAAKAAAEAAWDKYRKLKREYDNGK